MLPHPNATEMRIMIETALSDEYRPLKSYCNRFPGHRPGTRTHISTLIRLATHGTKDPEGRVVKLRAMRFGHKCLCTDA